MTVQQTLRKKRLAIGSSLVLAISLAACGGNSNSSSDNSEPSGTGGSIFVSGSSTVEPISSAVAKLFSDANPNIAIQVEGPGTGDGFAKFCNGESDVSNASRPIKAEEVEKCVSNGIEFIELKVAVDGLSVITSSRNNAIDCISFADLWVLLGPDATGRNNWNKADKAAAELQTLIGGKAGKINAPYPDASLSIVAPGEESGTFDSFVEYAMAPVAKLLGVEDDMPRPDYTASPNDNVIIEGISANTTSLGWVGFAFVEENLDKVKPLQVDAGKGCVEPSAASIAAGEYPIARALYIYVSVNKLNNSPALQSFIDLYLSDDGMSVIGTGVGQVPYVPLATTDLEATRSIWAAKTTGTRDGG
jgi:phosphate transport system substrate-binding protein